MTTVVCDICERRCCLTAGQTGGCGLYEVRYGLIAERFNDHYLVACPISIETMPMLHFYPGGKFLQITTTGCNFSCPGCISTVLVHELGHHSAALQHFSVEQIVEKAVAADCIGITFVMNDPLAAFPRFLKIARLAHARDLLVGCSSNGYFTEESIHQLLPCLDFINVGMKGFSDQAYHACGVAGIEPVLRNLRTMYAAGVHVEISCILTRENHAELEELIAFIATTLSRKIPLQVMRFLPFEAASPALEPTIREAEQFVSGIRTQLDYVYLFNAPGSDYLHSYCPTCGERQVSRDFYGPMGAKLVPEVDKTSRLTGCSHGFEAVGTQTSQAYAEGDFEGGYPFTRALEIVEAMLIAMGVKQKKVVAKAWERLLKPGGLQQLHNAVQKPRTYIDTVRQFGTVVGLSRRAEQLASYLEDRLALVEQAIAGTSTRPRVYYAMGKPLFYIHGGRLENQLVEQAGATSCNRELIKEGRPGRSLAVEELQRLDPQVIFVSAFISNTSSDFYDECLQLGLKVDALEQRRIHVHPAPGWDFGSPRWILGLLNMATILHPEHFSFDVMAEAEHFYQEFYQRPFDPSLINRSFSKPDCKWHWQD